MKPEALESLRSFALLGPGFGGDGFTLLTGLSEQSSADPALVFAPFEALGAQARIFAATSIEPCQLELAPPERPLRVELDAAGHTGKVVQIRESIARGDVYQVCLTERAKVEPVSGPELLRTMCRGTLPRFAAWMRLPSGEELVSASPELFFEIDGAHVRTQPMKGTAHPDAAGALAASRKDQSELAMITDLLRNDLATVCREKSVRVDNPRRVLELGYALQTVSDIAGELAPGTTALDVLAALHPGGSVTGAPKQAALAMIRQLEPTPRGAYCGALGLCRGQRSIFSLLIRTASRAADGWTYGVGGGIVYDSEPAAERAELEVKLGALKWPTRS